MPVTLSSRGETGQFVELAGQEDKPNPRVQDSLRGPVSKGKVESN